MSALRFVLTSAGSAGLAMAALGLTGAAFNAGLIAVVHRALHEPTQSLALAFLGFALGKVLSAFLSGRVTESYSQRSVQEIRRSLIERLLHAPYRRLEEIGNARAYAALTSDCATLNTALQATAGALVHAAILLGGVAYLVYLDLRACFFLLTLVLAGSVVYRLMSKRTSATLAKARVEHDRLFVHLSTIISGVKEFKLHAGRRRDFLDGRLRETEDSLLAYALEGQARYLWGQATNSSLVLGMIGCVLFLLPSETPLRTEVASGFVLTGLYLMGPLSSLLRLLPLYAAARLSLLRIADIGFALHGSHNEKDSGTDARPSFTAIELREVTHRYSAAGFVLGPINLHIAPSEIVFVTGNNGSGKSTLAKLLVGLYEPLAGQVLWDGRPVTDEERDRYRQLFSVVFADGFVFDRLYGIDHAGLDARANMWITQLGLSQVLSVRDGALSTIDLSHGQRKRVALLTALLEDRPIYCFDEWAAEQDASFKHFFYRSLLPELKARGKAVVVISHDDRFFDMADRVLALSDGHPAA